MELIKNSTQINDFLGKENKKKPEIMNFKTQIHLDFTCGCKIIQDFIQMPHNSNPKLKEYIMPCEAHKIEIINLNK